MQQINCRDFKHLTTRWWFRRWTARKKTLFNSTVSPHDTHDRRTYNREWLCTFRFRCPWGTCV